MLGNVGNLHGKCRLQVTKVICSIYKGCLYRCNAQGEGPEISAKVTDLVTDPFRWFVNFWERFVARGKEGISTYFIISVW